MKRLFWLIMICWSMAIIAQPNTEFRATWVVDFNWLQPSNSAEENKALIRKVLDDHVQANMTSVLWQVRRYGSVYYPSAIEPWGSQVNFQDPGFDPLGYAVEQAHLRGLELHAWFNTFESRFAYAGTPAQQHPEWICQDQDGNPMPNELIWLSPGIPAVRDHLRDVALEIVNNYDVDGVHMDFVRWNEHSNSGKSLQLARENLAREKDGWPDGMVSEEQYRDMSINSAGRYLYDQFTPYSGGIPSGYGSWEEYWRSSVTELVHAIHDSIQVVKPWVRLSPAALGRYNWGGWQGYGSVYQDAALWLNEGYIDQIVGMHYHWSSASDIYSVLEGGCPNCWSDFIQPAIQAGRLYSVGLFSDNFSTSNLFGRHESIINTVRTVSWADGVQFFSYASWRDEEYWDVAKSRFFQHKAKIRATGLIDDTPPANPTIALNKIDDLNYQILVTPPAGNTDNLWFAVYRSEDNQLDVTTDEIIQITFGNTNFDYTDAFDGTQDYNGSYWYFATALDRFWNESLPSGAFESDPIPSFAPVIVTSFPADGDTIPVNNNIELAFSKTMNPATFAGAVNFNPAVTVGNLDWASDSKSVTIVIDGDLQFATDYTMTLSASASDVNGRQLDGNGDGTEGDDFQLAFRTLDQDFVGPRITESYPNLQSSEDNFAIDEVITFVFDEFVDPATVDETSVFLSKNGVAVPFDYSVTSAEDYSILSIQADENLMPNASYTVSLTNAITDTLGNPMSSGTEVIFGTAGEIYTETIMVENFTFPGDWWQPTGSGSTVGVVVPTTYFGYTSGIVLPVPRPRKSAFLNYEWDTSASSHLVREYLNGGAPRNVLFDTSYVLQCYVYGDGSGTLFRFAIDENAPNGGATDHEVSTWKAIDWEGWRLVSWDLANDPTGTWLGDGNLQGALRFDSFQLGYDAGNSAISGRIFIEDLRLVKKQTVVVGIEGDHSQIPQSAQLHQNYPNPFNPATTIAYDIAENGKVSLKIFDVLGREVRSLVEERQSPGRYTVTFDASDLASGIYLYRLNANGVVQTRRMILTK